MAPPLKENPHVHEVGPEERHSTITSQRAEILGESDLECSIAETSNHLILSALDEQPQERPSSGDQGNPAFDDKSLGLSERRGKGKLTLIVVNRGDTPNLAESSPLSRGNLLTPGSTPRSACSTPLPRYTPCIEGPPSARGLSTNRRTSLSGTKKRIMWSYITQQQAQVAEKEVENGSENLSAPPPYLSAKDPGTRTERGQEYSSASMQKNMDPTPPVANALGLRPLILPAQLAAQDAVELSGRPRQLVMRQLILPQDIKERGKHGMTTLTELESVTAIPAAVSACGIGTLGDPLQLDDIAVLLNEGGVLHSTPKQSRSMMQLEYLPESLESLASTFGTTRNDSLVSISDHACDTLLLPSVPEAGSDWEVRIIGAYCITSSS